MISLIVREGDNEDSIKIKEQTRKLATDSSKHCLKLADRTDQVSHKFYFSVKYFILLSSFV